MFILCPHCQFLVAVDPGSGLPPLHCPRCDGALIAQADTPQPQAAGSAAVVEGTGAGTSDGTTPPVAAVEDGGTGAEPVAELAEPTAVEAADAGTPGEELQDVPAAPASSAKPAPSFARTGQVAAPTAAAVRWPQATIIAALALLLVVQILLADRDQLAADARWRAAMQAFCAALRCDLAPWREPAAITLLDRNVAPDPSHPGVLHVTASFRNDARWPQPWPRLVLTLSDVDGRLAGARAFEPREYLGHAVTKNGLASGQTASIAMDIVEPAPRIVAFTFDFR